jgi:uncharacterized damage-inducible protein DinB
MSYTAAELAKGFRTVRKNTIQIAHDIPEDKYDFVPAPGTMSVGRVLAHIALSPRLNYDMHGTKRITSFLGYDFFGANARSREEEAKPRSKAEIIDLLTTEGERFASWLDTLTPDFLAEVVTGNPGQPGRSRLDSLMGVKEHEMHHRGQLMLVQRILGIVPHLTRQRDEQRRQREEAKRGKA